MANLLDTQISIQQLDYLKEIFKRVIDSRRAFDKIQSLKDLKHVLKKRDYDLQSLYDQLNIINKTESSPKQLTSQNISNPIIHPQTILPRVPRDPVERIDQLIVNEIGQKWKDLARALGIPEGTIDAFSSCRLGESIREILKYNRNTEHNWKTKLCTALCEARRKDLSIKVLNILESSKMT